MADRDTSRISPTAHYTSFVWYRNGMSHPALVTPLGRAMFHGLRPFAATYERVGGWSLDSNLVARHRVIDTLLAAAIESGEVGQVVEVAAGLSPRGYQLARRYADSGLGIYVEGDLPGMAARKRRILRRAGLLGGNHRVVDLDALRDEGDASIFSVGERLLDPNVGTAVVTEGLLGYFDPDAVAGIWARFASFLSGFQRGLYLFDLNVGEDVRDLAGVRVFRKLLSAVARGRVYVHFNRPDEAENALLREGFASAELRRADDRVRELGLERMEGLERLDHVRYVQVAIARTARP